MADAFMPEYWPANRIIGKLEKALVKAENIVGQLESAQIKSLEASKVTGQLTNEQIKEIEAAKIAGKLTFEQIESIHAAQIVGKLVHEQIQSIEAGQITGQLENAQIKTLEAGKITGHLSSEQIESLEAAKISGQITETQIGKESVTTEKIKAANVTTAKLAASAITAEKIAASAITAEKIAAGAVETAKIKAGAVIAEKIAAGAVVAEKIGAEAVEAGAIKALAVTTAKIAAEAITAEKIAAGSITAGKIAAEAITAEKIGAGQVTTAKIAAGAITAEKITVATLAAITANLGTVTAGTIQDNELIMKEEEGTAKTINRISWKQEGTLRESIVGYRLGARRFIEITAGSSVHAGILAEGNSEVGKPSSLLAFAEPKEVIVINSEGKSSFLQLSETAKIKDYGLVSALPAEPNKGDRCKYIADKTNGIIWDLVYDGEGTYPWKFIGGPPMRTQYTAAEKVSTTSEVPQTTNAPSVTVPLKMEAKISYGAPIAVSGNAGSQVRMELFKAGVAQGIGAGNASAVGGAGGNTIAPLRGERQTTLVAAEVVQARYYQTVTHTVQAELYGMYLEVTPIRVG